MNKYYGKTIKTKDIDGNVIIYKNITEWLLDIEKKMKEFIAKGKNFKPEEAIYLVNNTQEAVSCCGELKWPKNTQAIMLRIMVLVNRSRTDIGNGVDMFTEDRLN